ncbi:MAG: lamin tail domain-containing protein, partial [Patescibacteria group bacterium]
DGDYVRGEIEVKGTVTDDNPDHYWLVAEEKESGDRVSDFPGVVDESDSLEDEVLHNWDTTDVDDGEYIIKLEARDAAGNKDPDQAPVSEDPEVDGDSVDWITVTVDNTAPEVPENLGFNATVEDYGSRPVEIECGGRVYQNQISHHWTEIDDAVEYERQWIRPGGDPEDEDAWEGSESWTTPYTNYRTFGGDPGTEGEWYVRVRARDEAGNWSDYSDPCAVHYYNRPVYEVEDGCPEGEVPVPVESLEIDSTSKDGETISLNGGEHYIFEAKGTYEFGSSGKVADSGYASNNNWQSLRTDIGIWEDALYRGVTSLLGDLGEGVGIIPWGDDNEDHEYSVAYRLNNNIEARFLISDWYGEWYDSVWNNQGAMSDNSGSLDLNIYKCGPVLESGDLLINEVYYQEPVCDERNDSGWIELYNVSDKEIPLKGWRLENSAGNEKEIKSNNVKLSPGEFAILSHAASTWNTCWEDVPEDVKTVHWIGSKSWLDTDSDSLTLYYGDEEADFVAWGEKEGDWDLIADKGESIARKGDCEGADDLECWEVSDDPTPGEDN